MRKLITSTLIAMLAVAAWGTTAHADDDLRAQIRDEIKAYEKEKKEEDGDRRSRSTGPTDCASRPTTER